MGKIINWHGCYDDNWKGEITPEAFSHPAKFSRALIKRIYGHMLDRGWIRGGEWVVDPFGGVALGGLDAMVHGLHWTGCELEQRFVDLGNENISLWVGRYGKVVAGTARLIQGDSRKLAQVIGDADGVVSSPPYENSMGDAEKSGIDWSKQADRKTSHPHGWNGSGYSQVGAVVTSPPYDQLGVNSGEGPNAPGDRHGNISSTEKAAKAIGVGYDNSPGQLGAMRAGDFDAVVTSRLPRSAYQHAEQGESDGQLANETGDTFWQAAKEIVQQCHLILKPGAYTAWVVKGYVKDKELVDFPGRWLKLCEVCGFEHVETVRAWLVKDIPLGVDLFSGEVVNKKVERKSFFRRLAEQKGSPRIDYETVLFLRKI